MKKIIIISIFMCVVLVPVLQAQDLEKIKASGNFIILIEKKEKSIFTKYATEIFTRKGSNEQESGSMYLLSPPKNTKGRNPSDLSFHYSQYIDFDLADMGIFTQVFYFDKSFIRKNKDVIVTEKLIKDLGFYGFLELTRGKRYRHFFVIDKDEIKNNKIKLKQVRTGYTNRE